MAHKRWYLAEHREARGLSQDQLAERVTELTEKWERPVRLTGGDISKLERNKGRRFNQDQLGAFAAALQCESPADLFYSPEDVAEIRRVVAALIRRGRSSDMRLLRALLGDDDASGVA